MPKHAIERDRIDYDFNVFCPEIYSAKTGKSHWKPTNWKIAFRDYGEGFGGNDLDKFTMTLPKDFVRRIGLDEFAKGSTAGGSKYIPKYRKLEGWLDSALDGWLDADSFFNLYSEHFDERIIAHFAKMPEYRDELKGTSDKG